MKTVNYENRIKAYKVFNGDWVCNPDPDKPFQYEVGGKYHYEGNGVLICKRGFHACKKLLDCFSYYKFNASNKVAEVEVWGAIDGCDHSSKIVASDIHIVRELSWSEVLDLCNSGHCNSGHCNSGDWNSGGWNACSQESGYFNTEQPDIVRVFNLPCDRKTWDEARKPAFIYFDLTCWVPSGDMTDDEKREHPDHEATGGYLRRLSYREAWLMAWDGANNNDKRLLYDLPNFDPTVFEKISGIDVTEDETWKRSEE